VLVGLGIVLLLILSALLLGSDNSRVAGPALSPRSVGPDGTRALMVLLERFGAQVRVDTAAPGNDVDVALVLRDRLDGDTSRELLRWVESGGRLVVTDPASNLTAPAVAAVASEQLVHGVCDDRTVAGVSRLDLGDGALLGVDSVYEIRTGATSCFGDGSQAYVVSEPHGNGTIVSLGGPSALVNERLAKADNSVLGVDLLAPADGTRIMVMDPNPPGQGDTALIDLVPDRVVQSILQLVVAFVVYALWRSRRLGRPVTEPQPVAIAGSRLVDAVGRLHQRSGSVDRAAADLRGDLRRQLLERYGLPAGAPPEALAEIVASRTAIDRERVRHAIGHAPIPDEDALVALANELDSIRQEALDVRR
jgi:hypothetical protein